MAARSSTSNSDASTSGSSGSSRSPCYIEHKVSKLDTLAGIAIKYGVEVADIKRLNSLTTDLQMFALKTLRIPLPGRHSPSATHTSSTSSLTRHTSSSVDRGLQYLASGHCQSTLNNGISYRAPEKQALTSAMGLLRGYYGLASMAGAGGGEGTEMDVYNADAEIQLEDQPYSPLVKPAVSAHSRRHSTGDRGEFSAFGYAESCDDELDGLPSSEICEKFATGSSLLMTQSEDPLPIGGIKAVSEAETQTNSRSVRRRSKAEMGSDEVIDVRERVTLLMKGSTPRPKEATATLPLPRLGLLSSNGSYSGSDGVGALSGMKSLGAALRGGKGAVDSLISKVRRSAGGTSVQEAGNVTASPSLLSPGLPAPSSVLEGLTSTVRRAKAALD